jgi:hypothetical protein
VVASVGRASSGPEVAAVVASSPGRSQAQCDSALFAHVPATWEIPEVSGLAIPGLVEQQSSAAGWHSLACSCPSPIG